MGAKQPGGKRLGGKTTRGRNGLRDMFSIVKIRRVSRSKVGISHESLRQLVTIRGLLALMKNVFSVGGHVILFIHLDLDRRVSR